MMDAKGNEISLSGHCKEKSVFAAQLDDGHVTCNEFKRDDTTTKQNKRALFYQEMNDHIESQNIRPGHTSVTYPTTNDDHDNR